MPKLRRDVLRLLVTTAAQRVAPAEAGLRKTIARLVTSGGHKQGTV